jgi:hypothetical protein
MITVLGIRHNTTGSNCLADPRTKGEPSRAIQEQERERIVRALFFVNLLFG